jgi:hypothetical protein
VLAALCLFFWGVGALIPDPAQLPAYATSSRQITGMSLMLILLPAYMLAAWSIAQRRSLDLVEQLRTLVPDARDADGAAEAIRQPMRARDWVLGSAIGIVFGLFNTNPIESYERSAVPLVDFSISLGQLFMWWIIGMLLVDRMHTARTFRALGEVIHFDLFRLDTLRPLARSGIIDVVIVAGALLFSPLQSLDARFRPENYRFALLVATPAMLFFVSWPLRSVYARIRAERDARVESIEAQLARVDAEGHASLAATAELETLLAHRDRLLSARTWPLDLRLVSRIFIYLIIPPLAWAGAALVERLVDTALGAH